MKVDLTKDEINYLSKVIITVMEKDLVFTNDKFKEGKITEDLKWKLMDVSEKIYEIEEQDWMTDEKIPHTFPDAEQKTKNYNENCKCVICSLIRRCE